MKKFFPRAAVALALVGTLSTANAGLFMSESSPILSWFYGKMGLVMSE